MMRASSRGYATIALNRCPLELDDGAWNTPIVPVQGAPFTSDTPESTLIDRWIEAKVGCTVRVSAGLVGVAVLVGLLAGCGQPARTAAPGSSTAAHGSQLPSACSKGHQQLVVDSQAVHSGELVTITRKGSWPDQEIPGQVPLQSPGQLGFYNDHVFKPLYYIFASIAGMAKYSQDIAFGPTVAVAGTALPDRAFRIRIPDVEPGSYVIEFEYVTRAHRSGSPIDRMLCAQLSIT